MLIDNFFQISKNTLDNDIMNFDKIENVSKNDWNSEDNVKSDIEHSVYKRFNNRLINLKKLFENCVFFFDKY